MKMNESVFWVGLLLLQVAAGDTVKIAAGRKMKDGVREGKFSTAVPSVDCQSKPQSELPFCDTSLSFMARAQDLESRLTTSEKIAQTSSIAPAIPRLGIKDYNWRSNCLHGWSKSGGKWTSDLAWTVFPAPIGLAATFNKDLVLKIGQATADEGRALHNEMLAAFDGSSTEAAGLNCFSPNVNLFRDPRWGRGQETYGEDPYLISQMGNAYTHGLQEGSDSKYLKIAACAKHFAVHSGPEEIRLEFKANVSLHDLYDTFLPAFKSQVLGAKVAQMMPAYSGLECKYQPDGAPDAANPFLLKTVLREQFGAPNISVVSDNGAVAAVYDKMKYVPNEEMAAAVCLNATTDLDLGHDNIYSTYLPKALEDKKVDLQSIRDAVVRSFYLRMRLGDFDPPSMVPYQNIDKSHLNTPQNQALNLQAARESIVLIKNSMLPLDPKSTKQITVIGPHANSTRGMLSNYEGIPSQVVTVLQGIQNVFKGTSVDVKYAPGCTDVKCEDMSKFEEALDLINNGDTVVMVMGQDESTESEGHDRGLTQCYGLNNDVLTLPGCQNILISRAIVRKASVILVLMNGGSISIDDDVFYSDSTAIVEAFYPGAQGGTAVADVIFGNYNPAGRMPVTTLWGLYRIAVLTDYYMGNRTYRYLPDIPQYLFGYGLSYSTFTYNNFTVSSTTIDPCDSIQVSVSVTNTGGPAGDEVIQLYVAPPRLKNKPYVQLLSFDRVALKPSQNHVATFELNPYLLSLVDEDGEHYIFPGQYQALTGHQPDHFINDFNDMLKANFTIAGNFPVKTSTCSSSPQCLAC